MPCIMKDWSGRKFSKKNENVKKPSKCTSPSTSVPDNPLAHHFTSPCLLVALHHPFIYLLFGVSQRTISERVEFMPWRMPWRQIQPCIVSTLIVCPKCCIFVVFFGEDLVKLRENNGNVFVIWKRETPGPFLMNRIKLRCFLLFLWGFQGFHSWYPAISFDFFLIPPPFWRCIDNFDFLTPKSWPKED